tara:strand:- start:699 stop:1007 length:309 start_codon:yes stop_codon:yes gene_type:complete
MLLEKLIADMLNELEENKEAIVPSDYPEDMIFEVVDAWIPVYYYDLSQLLAEDNSLAEVDDVGLLPDNPSVWNILTTAVYERLSTEAHQWLYNEQEKEREDA